MSAATASVTSELEDRVAIGDVYEFKVYDWEAGHTTHTGVVLDVFELESGVLVLFEITSSDSVLMETLSQENPQLWDPVVSDEGDISGLVARGELLLAEETAETRAVAAERQQLREWFDPRERTARSPLASLIRD